MGCFKGFSFFFFFKYIYNYKIVKGKFPKCPQAQVVSLANQNQLPKASGKTKKQIAKSINQEQESCVAKGIKLRSIRNKEDYQILNYQNKIIN